MMRKILTNPMTSPLLSMVAIVAVVVMGVWSYFQTNDLEGQVISSIGENTDATERGDAQVSDSVGALAEVNKQIAGFAGSIRDHTGETVSEIRKVANAFESRQSPSAVVEDQEERAVTPGNLGVCQPGFVVRTGESCWASGDWPFEVHENYAWSPWDAREGRNRNTDAIKVDPPNSDPSITFQAKRIGVGVWRVLATGPWMPLGTCERHMLVRAGQYCTERQSDAPFRVYATDELNPGETRPLYLDGYAVLFWFGSGTPDPANRLLHDQQVRSGDHFLAEAAGDGLWRIVRAD